MTSLLSFRSVRTEQALYNLTYLENSLNTIMKIAIAVSFIFYIASVTAIEKGISDRRYPIDSQRIQATLNKSELIDIRYTVNKTAIDYYISGERNACGPFKVELDENSVYAEYSHLLPLYEGNILVIPMVHDSTYKQYPALIEIIKISSCKRIQIVLPNKSKPTEFRITSYVDSFDIYYKDSSSCSKSYCQATYDYQGKALSSPPSKFISNKEIPIIKPLESGVRSNKYVALEWTAEKIIVNLVDSEKANVLAESTDTKFIPEVSNSKNLISVLYRTEFETDANQELITNLVLSQFDLNGNLKFKTTVKYSAIIRTTRMLNGPNGGVYLVASPCDRDHCTDEQNIYYVKKIDGNGKEVGTFSLKLLSPGIIEDLALYEADKSYCLTRAQLGLGVSGNWQFKKLDILFNYFTDKDFE